MSRKAILVYGAIALAALGLLTAAAFRFERPATAARVRTSPKPEPEPPKYEPALKLTPVEMAERLDDGACKGLILDLKLAAVNGSESTQRGLIRGLKNHGRAAKALLRQELAASQDPRITKALDAALKEMP